MKDVIDASERGNSLGTDQAVCVSAMTPNRMSLV
jgi:hypothetical protein